MRNPNYTDIYKRLKEDIAGGRYPFGTSLPGEIRLAGQFQVARETLRRALAELEKDHLISRRQGCRSHVRYYCGRKKKILFTAPELKQLPVSFQQSAAEAGVETMFLPLGIFRKFTLTELDSFLQTEDISGIILSGSAFYPNEELFDNLRQLNIPVVLVFACCSDFRFNTFNGIYYDLQAGWKTALGHLAGQSCRRVGTLAPEYGGKIRDIPVADYLKLLRTLGLSDDHALLFRRERFADLHQLNHPEQYGGIIQEEVIRMLSLPEPADAFICFNDQWAPFVYRAAARTGKKIPDDMAVMGFISSFDCNTLDPPLSSIEVEYRKVYDQAIRWLLDPPAERQVLPMEQLLRVRGSTKKTARN